MIDNNLQFFQPLITVVVITYNSSVYVLETLNSIVNQTYRNIELIISDDCSTDNTAEVCKGWINQNGNKFKGAVRFIKTEKNGGVCANCNNGLKYAKGEWIKIIGGDDKLRPICLESFADYVATHEEKFIICKQEYFSIDCPSIKITPADINPWIKSFPNAEKKARKQELYLLRNSLDIPGATVFIHRETLNRLGGFEEKYPFVEDFPLAMKFLKNNYPIGCVDEILIDYRVHPQSVSHSNKKFADSIYAAIDDYCIPAAKKLKKPVLWYHYWSSKKLRNNSYPKLIRYLLRSLDFFYLKKKYLNSTKFK